MAEPTSTGPSGAEPARAQSSRRHRSPRSRENAGIDFDEACGDEMFDLFRGQRYCDVLVRVVRPNRSPSRHRKPIATTGRLSPTHRDALAAEQSHLGTIAHAGEITRRTDDAPPRHVRRAGWECPTDGSCCATAADGQLRDIGIRRRATRRNGAHHVEDALKGAWGSARRGRRAMRGMMPDPPRRRSGGSRPARPAIPRCEGAGPDVLIEPTRERRGGTPCAGNVIERVVATMPGSPDFRRPTRSERNFSSSSRG